MKKMYYNKMVIGLFGLLLITADIRAQRNLVIPEFRQSGYFTCWAACARMILRAYDTNNLTSELEMRRWVFGTAADSANSLSGTSTATDRVLEHFSQGNIRSYSVMVNNVPGCHTYGCILATEIVREINGGRPLLAGLTYMGGEAHMVVIRGYSGTSGSNIGNVIYNDPRDGVEHSLPYSDFILNNDFYWDETLVLTTNPRIPIPVSIGPNEYVQIDDFISTREITQSPQFLVFYAYKSGDVPIEWRWKLIFPYTGGEYIAASWTYSSSNPQSLWNIPNFVLPTNYLWKYNFDGIIPGRVEVSVSDIGGPPAHDDARNVIYIPSGPLYLGTVIFANETVSGTQPEIKAHELILIENSIFLYGSNINFKSGENIIIERGVDIRGDNIINFIVDPLIR